VDLKNFLTTYQSNKQIITEPNDKGKYVLFGDKVFKDASIKLTYDEGAYTRKEYCMYDSKTQQLFLEYKGSFRHYIYDITNLTTPDIDYSLFNDVLTYKGVDLCTFHQNNYNPGISYYINKHRILIEFDANYNITRLNIFKESRVQPIFHFYQILNEYEEKVKPHLPTLIEFLKSDFKPEIIYI
jgi:hypothetical protein